MTALMRIFKKICSQ